MFIFPFASLPSLEFCLLLFSCQTIDRLKTDVFECDLFALMALFQIRIFAFRVVNIRHLNHCRSSASKNAYYNFDVPHEEQDLITEEERQSVTKTIQDVMKDVVVYVEVRTAEDNRTAGVKKVISDLGAKVNDKFLR